MKLESEIMVIRNQIILTICLLAGGILGFPTGDDGEFKDLEKRDVKTIMKSQDTDLDKCKDFVPNTDSDNYEKHFFIFVKQCITGTYEFKEGELKDGWGITGFPELNQAVIQHDHFKLAAKVAEAFFQDKVWPNIVDTYKKVDKCQPLLRITEARYIYVTYLLNEASKDDKEKNGALSQCAKKSDKMIVPDDVCFPAPVGSALCTSDYDVGLVGPSSGLVTARFNDIFQEAFGYSSERAFDTNIYAFSLEYAMPYIFADGPLMDKDFRANLQKMEESFMYQGQDLFSALYKIKKYDRPGYEVLMKDVDESKHSVLKDTVGNNGLFDTQVKKEEQDDKDKQLDPTKREDANKKYSALVQEMSQGASKAKQFTTQYIQTVFIALMYAAEAYHSRGTMRYVVGHLQMRNKEVTKRLTDLDRLTTILEDWGDTMKEFGHLQEKGSNEALVKMSKYLYRTFLPMTELKKKGDKMKNGPHFPDVTKVFETIRKIYKIKQDGGKVLPADQESLIGEFEENLDCRTRQKVDPTTSVPKACMEKAFEIVRTYFKEAIENMIVWKTSTS